MDSPSDKNRVNITLFYHSSVLTCPSCGQENPDLSKFCMNCGYSFPLQQPQVSRRPQQFGPPPYQQRFQNQGYGTQGYIPKYQQPLSAWAYICSCCIPLAGFAIYLSIKDTRPDEANTVLILAIISIFVAFISGISS